MKSEGGLIFAFGLFFGGVLITLWQAYMWVRHGMWPPMDCITAMLYLAPESQWLNWPQDWIGLHKMLSNVHAGLAMMLISAPVSAINAN